MNAQARSVVVSLALLGVAGLLYGGRTLLSPQPETTDIKTVGFASWNKVDSLDALLASSDLVIQATVVKVEPGRYEAPSSPHLNVSLNIENVLYGKEPKSNVIVVEQPGGVYVPTHQLEEMKLPTPTLPKGADDKTLSPEAPEEGEGVMPPQLNLEMADDPHYQFGEKVVLFLKWDSLYQVYALTTIQGRYQLQDGKLYPTLHESDSVTQELSGKTLEASKTLILQSVR